MLKKDTNQRADAQAHAERTLLPCPFQKSYPSELNKDDSYYMQLALNEAIEAWKEDEVPIGAIIVLNGEIIAKAHNRRDSLKDPTAHAEMIAITQASSAIGDWRLNEATLYVTKEPCPMCAGASIMSRLGRVVFSLEDEKMGCLGGATNLNHLGGSNHRCELTSGILRDECREIIQAYFQSKRSK